MRIFQSYGDVYWRRRIAEFRPMRGTKSSAITRGLGFCGLNWRAARIELPLWEARSTDRGSKSILTRFPAGLRGLRSLLLNNVSKCIIHRFRLSFHKMLSTINHAILKIYDGNCCWIFLSFLFSIEIFHLSYHINFIVLS